MVLSGAFTGPEFSEMKVASYVQEPVVYKSIYCVTSYRFLPSFSDSAIAYN